MKTSFVPRRNPFPFPVFFCEFARCECAWIFGDSLLPPSLYPGRLFFFPKSSFFLPERVVETFDSAPGHLCLGFLQTFPRRVPPFFYLLIERSYSPFLEPPFSLRILRPAAFMVPCVQSGVRLSILACGEWDLLGSSCFGRLSFNCRPLRCISFPLFGGDVFLPMFFFTDS